MYQTSGSLMKNLAKGSASMWLQRSSIKYVQLNSSNKVNKLNAPENLLSDITKEVKVFDTNSTKSVVDVAVASIDSDIHRLESKQGDSLISEKVDGEISTKAVAVDNKDKEIELLKMKLRMSVEKSSQMEITLNEMKVKNTNLQQRIIQLNEKEKETDKTVKLLQNSLSSKTNELLQLKEKFNVQCAQHQTCQKKLNETKNQLHYKHLALDGIIKSSIKLQERLDVAATITVTASGDESRSSCQQQADDRDLTSYSGVKPSKSILADTTDNKSSTSQQKDITPALTDRPTVNTSKSEMTTGTATTTLSQRSSSQKKNNKRYNRRRNKKNVSIKK